MSKKTESTASLIPKDTKDPSLASPPKSDGASAPWKTSSSTPTSTTTTVPTSLSDFAQKSKDNGWNAPTPTKPSLG
ncbi:hypothetical protein E1B28_012844 [Marasmius oreades]|uniref:Uncharacterized protein n=1 Tax=Marasmius oreades TaxID=181124 RepID=A0A9P7RSF9_9AGAR|nr:uncharacterized protein E1B28_012844 [Marasmius oreades]KAG7088899.1 hypothetical protein E1B28_012844 [Marasmius oreades]